MRSCVARDAAILSPMLGSGVPVGSGVGVAVAVIGVPSAAYIWPAAGVESAPQEQRRRAREAIRRRGILFHARCAYEFSVKIEFRFHSPREWELIAVEIID